jgi:hypothetical protein
MAHGFQKPAELLRRHGARLAMLRNALSSTLSDLPILKNSDSKKIYIFSTLKRF